VHIAIRAAGLAWQPEFHNIQIRDIKANGDRVGSEQGGDAVCARDL
jgi:hypothetical protein